MQNRHIAHKSIVEGLKICIEKGLEGPKICIGKGFDGPKICMLQNLDHTICGRMITKRTYWMWV